MISKITLLGVGGIEAVLGLWALVFPAQALPGVVGRLLSVGAVQSSPALLPSVANAGALRAALGLVILGYATGPTIGDTTHKLEACVVAHACLLQPFAATFRSHPRMPIGSIFAISLLEGGAIVAGLAADADFEIEELGESAAFVAAAVFLCCGIILALISCCTGSCAKGAVMSDEDALAGAGDFKGSGQMPLFDENRHRLSPTAKRLLS